MMGMEKCPTCGSQGFDASLLPDQCSFCDGTEAGHPPTEDDIADALWKPPAYGTKGWVLVEILGPGATGVYRYEVEEWAVDEDASTYWISEGVGIEFWLDWNAPPDLKPGWYMFEGVVGTYIRGQSMWETPCPTDDDETWEYESIRPATIGEQVCLCYAPSPEPSMMAKARHALRHLYYRVRYR